MIFMPERKISSLTINYHSIAWSSSKQPARKAELYILTLSLYIRYCMVVLLILSFDVIALENISSFCRYWVLLYADGNKSIDGNKSKLIVRWARSNISYSGIFHAVTQGAYVVLCTHKKIIRDLIISKAACVLRLTQLQMCLTFTRIIFREQGKVNRRGTSLIAWSGNWA